MYKFRYLQFNFVYLLEKNKKCGVDLGHSPKDKYTSSFCYFLINQIKTYLLYYLIVYRIHLPNITY